MTTPSATVGYAHLHGATGTPAHRRRGGQSLTTATFIARAALKHGNRYDYSQVQYEHSLRPVTISCPEHGQFDQTPNSHLYGGAGCPACGHRAQAAAITSYDTEAFVARARKIHGSKWEYSKSEYDGFNSKLIIGCPEHGDFPQTPNNHIHGKAGCPVCGEIVRARNSSLSQEDFVTAARLVHGGKYGYDLARYAGIMTKVEIQCIGHTFWIAPNGFLAGKTCRKCAYEARELSAADFVQRATKLFHGKYDYSLVTGERARSRDDVTIVCPEHGPFTMPASRHLMGAGCSGCSESHGERQVRAVLNAAGIPFVTEWGHPTLRNKLPLRFDFMLPTEKTLIEFDGEFHRRPVQMPGQTLEQAEQSYRDAVLRDGLKNEWAAANGWELVRLNDLKSIENDLRIAGVLTGKASV